MTYFIGIDVSTTATKALLIDENGAVVSISSSEYAYDVPSPLWSEQDPDLWWESTLRTVRATMKDARVQGSQVRAIGLTGQMHGLVLLDKHGEIVRPSILWNDQRSGAECDEIRSRLGKERLISITGNDALTGLTAAKILWVQNNEPDLWRITRHILLPKDYVRYKLTGKFAVDCAGGSGTQLFDVKTRTWSQEMISALEIPTEYLPPIFEGTYVTGTLSSEVSDNLGLEPGILVVGGGGDQAAAAIGTGAVEEGIASISLGTSGVVFATTEQPSIDPEGRLHTFCHAVPGKWHLMGVMLSAAGSLRWHNDTLAPDQDLQSLLTSANEIAAGSDGLLFLPYLTGERSPYPDPLARGAFVGLTVRHGLPHMTRAVLEGVAFGLLDNFQLMRQAGIPEISQVRVTGGGAKSPLWLQILSDTLNTELVTVNSHEGAAYGAALLAATGAGMFNDIVTACRETIKITGNTFPSDATETYGNLYTIYRNLYPALKPTFNSLA